MAIRLVKIKWAIMIQKKRAAFMFVPFMCIHDAQSLCRPFILDWSYFLRTNGAESFKTNGFLLAAFETLEKSNSQMQFNQEINEHETVMTLYRTNKRENC